MLNSYQLVQTTTDSKLLNLEKKFEPRKHEVLESCMLENRLAHSIIRNGRRWSESDICLKNRTINNLHLKYQFLQYKFHKNKSEELSSIKHEVLPLNHKLVELSEKYIHPNVFDDLVYVRSTIKKGRFGNIYSPSRWYMDSNYKKNSGLHLSDVVAQQYEIASTKSGFTDIFPSVLCRRYMANEYIKPFLSKYAVSIPRYRGKLITDRIINEFLSIPYNGKSTFHILKTFGLKVIDIDITEVSVYLHLSPDIVIP